MNLAGVLLVAAITTVIAGCCCDPVGSSTHPLSLPPSPPLGGASGTAVPARRPITAQPEKPLALIPRQQEGFYSCWSTSGEMVMEYLNPPRHRQCQQSDLAFSQMNCCQGSGELAVNTVCDRPWLPEFSRWNFTCQHQSSTPLTWIEAKAEIDAGRPFAFSWRRKITTSPSHMMIVVGYDQGQSQLLVLDPKYRDNPDFYAIEYADYSGASLQYEHEDDFYLITPGP